MRFVLVSLTLFFSLNSFSQNGRTPPAMEEFPTFIKTTMLVVLFEDEPEYNQLLTSTIEKYWKITPYKIIPFGELNEYINDYEYSMMIRNNSERIVKRVGRTDRIKSNHLAIYNGNKGMDLRGYTGADALTQYHFEDINETSDYAWKLPVIIKSMQHYLFFLKDNEITEDNHQKKVEEFNNELSRTIGKRTLYLLKEQLSDDFNDIRKIQKTYKYAVKISTKEELAGLINQEDGDAAFIHLDPRVKDIYVMTADTGRILYHASVHERGSLGKKDFSNLYKRAGY